MIDLFHETCPVRFGIALRVPICYSHRMASRRERKLVLLKNARVNRGKPNQIVRRYICNIYACRVHPVPSIVTDTYKGAMHSRFVTIICLQIPGQDRIMTRTRSAAIRICTPYGWLRIVSPHMLVSMQVGVVYVNVVGTYRQYRGKSGQ